MGIRDHVDFMFGQEQLAISRELLDEPDEYDSDSDMTHETFYGGAVAIVHVHDKKPEEITGMAPIEFAHYKVSYEDFSGDDWDFGKYIRSNYELTHVPSEYQGYSMILHDDSEIIDGIAYPNLDDVRCEEERNIECWYGPDKSIWKHKAFPGVWLVNFGLPLYEDFVIQETDPNDLPYPYLHYVYTQYGGEDSVDLRDKQQIINAVGSYRR